jgi:hypothetical protein
VSEKQRPMSFSDRQHFIEALAQARNLGIACGRAETRESLLLIRCQALIRHIDAVREKLIDDAGYAQLIDTSG